MKVLILEDETLAGQRVENLLAEIDSSIEVLTVLKSIDSATEWFTNNESPDLVLSDIRLLDGLSFQIFEEVNYKNPVIFTTAYDQYAIKAFEVNSIDYLLKPIQKEKLENALGKLQQKDSSMPFDELKKMIAGNADHYKSRFMIRAGQKILAVPTEKIAYFYSANKLTYIVTPDDKRYPCDQTLEQIDQQLDPKVFFRANRKFIVKFDAIAEIHPYFKGRMKIEVAPTAEEDIVISADRTPLFKKWLDM